MNDIKVFKNASLIDGKGDAPVKDAMVIIEGDRIKYAGVFDDKRFSESDSQIFDLKGMTLMPGLIDTHVHLGMQGDPDNFRTMVLESPALTSIKAAQRARKTLEAGITTIRDMGEKGHIDIAVKRAIEEGVVIGPRVMASGKALTITGGHGDMFPEGVIVEGIGRIVDGADEARKAAREQIKLGADNVKMMATGGGMSPGPGTVAQLTIDEMRAAVEEAEKFGKTTGAHCIGTDGIKNALKAGVRTIDHGTFLDDEGIELLLEKNAYLVPTLAAFKTLKYGKNGGVPEYHIKKVEYYQTKHTENLRRAIAAGVKIIMGTDAGTPFNYHGENAYELECLVDNGLSEMDAIKCGTSVAAEALMLPDVGVIEEGKIADMIVVDGNPFEDIKVLQETDKIKMVFKEGKLLVQRK